MSNGFISFLTRMMYLSACYAILCHATQAVTHKGTSKKRRCRKVCIKEFDKLKQKVKELEEKLELLLLQKKPGENFPIFHGSKGDPGPPGPQGPRGPKGDCGTLGLPGGATKGGFSVSSLPKCTLGEYITSDGNKLFCVKLTNNQIAHTLPHNLQVRQDAPPPTLTTELKVQLQFLNKPVQTMSADAWDLHSFTWNQNTYLGISQLSEKKTFILYKWVQNVFVEKADLTIPHARKWTSFEWEGHLYIVIACNTENRKDKPGYSYIYRMAYDSIEEYQKLDTQAAFAVNTIIVDGQLFIAFAYIYGKESQVFKWSNGIFIKHHKIPTIGTDIDAFHIDNHAFLAVVGTSTKDEVAYLLEYKNGKFIPFKNIRMDTKPYGITHIQTGNEHFLAIGRYHLSSSVLCRWNGETFQEVQKIDSCGARDFAVKTTHVNGQPYTYMVVINESCKPVVFVYEQHRKLFVKLQDIDSTNTRDVEFLSIPNSNTLYLVVATNQETTIYKESGS